MFKEAALRKQSVAKAFSEFNPQECGLIAFFAEENRVFNIFVCKNI